MKEIAKLLRCLILTSTTEAGSGHPTSSLSAVELISTLMFDGFFKFNIDDPKFVNNDRLIFSKGHASPLFYALWAVAGGFPLEEMKTLRQFGSRLEGHPTMEFPFTEAPTGSLGQGLSIGVGMALNAKYIDKLPYKTYVLLGDSEMAEGSVWEALQSASHYKLNNLVGIIDVNRLGQSGETMLGHDVETYSHRVGSFGWNTEVVDGHSWEEVKRAFEKSQKSDKPFMIVAKTLKGKGISFLEDKEGWHGKPLDKEQLEKALQELGEVDMKIRGKLNSPDKVVVQSHPEPAEGSSVAYKLGDLIATRKAYGNGLIRLYDEYPDIVVLDAETSNSTYSETIKKTHPDRFFEMYIAEQNMAGAAIGFSCRGKIPLASTFAAFWSRAHDQIRMAQYAGANIKFVGSHAGVSIGSDGSSQMALEDISMMRSIHDSVVLYPSDAVSTEILLEEALKHHGIVYLRTTRAETPVLYKENERFAIGGSYVLKESNKDDVTVIGAGITLHEALKAYDILAKEGISIRVIDLYSVKPIDKKTIETATKETKAIITVEDHYQEGGLGEAVKATLVNPNVPIHIMVVNKIPHSGKPEELLDYEEISAQAIVKKIKEIVSKK